MSFPRKYLNEGEQIVLDLRPHWVFLVPSAALAVVALVLTMAASTLEGDVGRYALYASLVLVVLAAVRLLARIAVWTTTCFVVTTDRLIHRHGVFAKAGREIPLERLNDISFSQTLLQRVLKAGDVLIESAGERGQQHFRSFPHPERTQNEIHRQIELAQARDADRMAGARRELSPLEQLDKLAELRDRGVLSQAEFEAKKAELLGRM